MTDRNRKIGATEEGRKRYPPDGLLDDPTLYEAYPCTCSPECRNPCDGGACGCRACREPWAAIPSIN